MTWRSTASVAPWQFGGITARKPVEKKRANEPNLRLGGFAQLSDLQGFVVEIRLAAPRRTNPIWAVGSGV